MLTAVVLTLALSACGGSESSSTGWSTHQVDDGGFSIETPAAWRATNQVDPDKFDEFVEENPNFAPFADVVKGGLIKFVALDPDAADNFSTNANVLVHNLGRVDISLVEYARQSAASTRNIRAGDIQVKLVRLPAGRSARLTYEYDIRQAGKEQRLAILQFAFLREGSEYVVTFTTLPSLKERYRTTFARAARSFRFD